MRRSPSSARSPRLLTTLATIVLLGLCACNKLTVANYERIHAGMSFDEVTGLIGSPGQCDETLGLRSCQWGDDSRNIRINFVAGKAVLFTAHGLK